MKKQALSIAVMIAGAYPAASSALSLGDIESNSNLNQPLRAKIELLAAGAQDAKQLQVRLAPASVFNRVGIERPAFLDNLRFATSVQNGKPVILVSSDRPITEPFVNFLLEVSWPQGQLLKEYTVMLDPPVLMQPGNTVAGNEAAVRAEPRANGTVNRPAPVPAQPEPEVIADAQEPVQAVPQTARQVRVQQQPRRTAATRQAAQQRAANPATSANRSYRVRQGDTLFKVASQLSQPGTNIDQMMMALYRANPQAFIDGNINGLKSGVTLKAPGARSVQSVSRAEARRQVRQHYVDWKKIRATTVAGGADSETPSQNRPASNPRPTDDNARLEVLGSKEKAGANENVVAGAGKERLADLEKELSLARESLSSQQRENTELKSRVDELEAMLRKKNRLITLRDEQLAELQKTMNGASPAAAQVQPSTPTATPTPTPVEAQLAPKPTEPNPAVPTPVAPEANNPPVINQQTPPVNPDSVPAQADGSDIQNYLGNTNNTNEVVRTDPNQQTAGMGQPNPPVNNEALSAMTPAERAAAAAAALNGGLNPAHQPNPVQNLPEVNVAPPVQPEPPVPAQPTEPKPLTAPTPEAQNPAPSPFVDAEQTGDDLMSMLSSPLAWKIGAGALLSLLLLALLARFLGKRKSTPSREPAFNATAVDSTDEEFSPVVTTGHGDFSDLDEELRKAEKQNLAYNEADDDPFGTRVGNVHGGSTAKPSIVPDPKPAPTEDEDEVLMEANVYIAYGLHQQAESELKKALEKHPERLEYRHKLLENYFAANNREAFDEQAQLFANSRNVDRQSKLWKDVMTWGGKISPDNPLYNANTTSGLGKLAAAGAAVAGAAGLAMHSKAQADEPTEDVSEFNSAPKANSTISLKDDLAAALNALDEDELADSKQDHEDEFDFNLDDFDKDLAFDTGLNNKLSSADREGYVKAGRQDLNTAETGLLADDDLDFNLDDLISTQATEQKVEKVEKVVPQADSLKQDDFEALDNFDFDAPLDLDQAKAPVAEKAPQQTVDDLDEMLDLDFDELTKTVDTPQAAAPTVDADDANNILDFDLEQLTLDEQPVSATGKAAAALNASKPVDNVTSLNLHLDKDTGIKKILPQDTFYMAPEAVSTNPDDDWLGDIDEALSFLDMPEEELDLHEAHISTKLDLARAYLDMGDIEGARSTLEEVMVEGNDNQRREAETLLHQTG